MNKKQPDKPAESYYYLPAESNLIQIPFACQLLPAIRQEFRERFAFGKVNHRPVHLLPQAGIHRVPQSFTVPGSRFLQDAVVQRVQDL